jgi:hypothetical protein
MKAVLITKNNQKTLAARYFIDPIDFDDRLPLDYYLVCAFGVEEHYELLTKAELDEHFTTTGALLANDFFEIVPI